MSHSTNTAPRQFVAEPGPLVDVPIPAYFLRRPDGDAAPLAPHPTGTEARLCDDVARRQALGLRKYGCTVANNPLCLRQWLQHAYEEALDQAVYLRRAIEEIDAAASTAHHPEEPTT